MQNRRVVLDTNVLIASLSRRGNYYPVWEGFQEGKYTLCISNDILEEYIEIIGEKMTPEIAEHVAGGQAVNEEADDSGEDAQRGYNVQLRRFLPEYQRRQDDNKDRSSEFQYYRIACGGQLVRYRIKDRR